MTTHGQYTFQTDDGMVVELTQHAMSRMISRHVHPAEVGNCLARPSTTYPSRGRRLFRADDIVVVVDLARLTVVTVLYACLRVWSDSDGRPSKRVLSRKQVRRMAAEMRRLPRA
ncbi:hypothetical protein [Georgenia sp. AZ-5]|uniref:hypothetical protein n=1 Tax=Georgenia sp. AZ-5 TaxID=3367526 RepID=UPI003753F849